ncbi:hypothetical protein AXX12_13445 [Anaerosporomusa subterranea]|uniref:site-specific DNA-methyltransferase (adenine-specific) n=1 Tax=Anaerosporomusa subterranea TaxID=1794912 RepID=A0A154BMG9_ANASB|nr:TaqI-like C-terminal specificity domain-containing protein [Anaerosporomusa subterranea]KYZ75169.1 hypothetical protein AXX12_13445 [Anaerosporomusa subterranea]
MTVQSKRSARTAASAYEQSLDVKTRKAGGVYYTPPDIISYILSHTVEQADVTTNPFVRVLDPACGSGLFLLAAYDVLLRKFRENIGFLRRKYAADEYVMKIDGKSIVATGEDYWREENLHQHLVRFCLFGADSDAAALALAADSLAAKSLGENMVANLMLCDSLTKWEQEEGLFANSEAISELTTFWATSFDYIIGNPPYIPVTRMNSSQKAYYRANYQCAEGRLNTFALFVERAIEKASGKIGLIVPSRLLLNTQYGAIRRHILSQTTLELVHEAKEGIFEDVVVDTVVLIMAKGCPRDAAGQVVIERQQQGLTIAETLDANALLAASNSFISFAAGRTETLAVAALERLSVPLGDIADIRDGIIQGAVGAELFLGDQLQSDSRCKPVLFGHMIEPYFCHRQNEYIWYDPTALTELENSRTQGRGRGLRLRSAAVFQRPKILSRQTADHIIAAMDDQGYYYMNTLHGTAITDSSFDPWYVLAVMNSALIRCWYAWRFAETGRSFAQVKIANLKTLPVLLLEPEQRQKIALLARQVASARKQGQDYRFLLPEIDDILYSYSSLDKQTVQIMQEFINKISAQTVRRRTRRENNVNTID